jgi:uncharacterized membrane protein HdeD (DUF308 family)
MMSTEILNAENPIETVSEVIEHELHRLHKQWKWFLLLGAVLVIAGVVALSYPFASSVGVVMILGALLIIGGLATIIGAFWAGKWSAFVLQLLVGILYVMAGMVIRDTPLESTALLTLFIAAMFVMMGIFRTVVAFVERFPQWGWALLNGLVTLTAGVIIYDAYPLSAFWVIGLLVGLDLLFNGWTWIMLAFALRRIGRQSERDAATTAP